MGSAQIISGGEDGRYTIKLDFGKATRDGALAQLAALISKMEIDIATTQARIAEEQAEIDDLTEQRTVAVNAYVEAAETLRLTGSLPPGSTELSTKEIDFLTAQIMRATALLAPLRRRLDAQRFILKQAQLDVVRWTSIVVESTRQAWCTTLKEDAPAGSYAATIDIPGDSNLVLLAPGCRVWQPSDGYLRARATMSPEQAFWTAAVQPGWQKYKPTYRWGTATAIDYEGNTMNVALFDQRSDAQSLPVNQASSLVNVPVTYMTCDANAFEVGDRVVVQFQGQDWAAPRVIGFLDNPKGCRGWELTSITPSDIFSVSGGEAYGRVWEFYSNDPALDAEVTGVAVDDATFEYRVDRGAWVNARTVPVRIYDEFGDYVVGSGGSVPLLVDDERKAGFLQLLPPEFFFPSARFRVHINSTDALTDPDRQVDGMPPGSIVEFRVTTAGGAVLVNVAIQNDAAPTYLARTRARILASNAAALSYELYLDTGT